MKKIMYFLLALLLVSTVSATIVWQERYRANGGVIEYIGTDTDINVPERFPKAGVSFIEHNFARRDLTVLRGAGRVMAQGTTESGRFILAARFNRQSTVTVLERTEQVLRVEVTGLITLNRVSHPSVLLVEVDKVNGKLTITGDNFKITNMNLI